MVPLTLIKQTALLSLLFLSLSFSASAITYTSMSDGDWADPTIWSTDGGATSCGCIPSEPTAGNDVVIKHIVDMVNYNVITITGGSQVKVYPYLGQLIWTGAGGGKVDVQDGQFYVNNYVDLNQLDVGVNGNVTIIGYSAIEIHNTINISGQLHVYGGYFTVSNGNLTFNNTAEVVLTNFSKIDVTAGNLENFGDIYISGNSCLQTKGTWKNKGGGNVMGDGAAVSTAGSFQNVGVWQASVNWCGGGSGSGMPPMDCAGVNDVCGMLVLGVAFGDFEAVKMEKEVELYWNTVTERDNDYFIIERSQDGSSFETLGMVDGSGTTEWETSYTYQDIAPEEGLNYYRLQQVDVDGNVEYTPLRVVSFGVENLKVVKSYNLMGQEINDNYSGVVIDLLEDGSTRKRFKL